jgi:hypothetical protein
VRVGQRVVVEPHGGGSCVVEVTRVDGTVLTGTVVQVLGQGPTLGDELCSLTSDWSGRL